MSFAVRVSPCLLVLSLSLISAALGQTQSVPHQSVSSEAHDLAAALAGAASEEERDLLLARKKGLMNSSLLVALRALSNLYVQKGDYAGALRICQLAVGINESPVLLGGICAGGRLVKTLVGIVHARHSPARGLVGKQPSGGHRVSGAEVGFQSP